MEILAKLKEKKGRDENEKLVLLLLKKGKGIEYSVHTEINGNYFYGHYFDNFWSDDGLEKALEFYNNYEKKYF